MSLSDDEDSICISGIGLFHALAPNWLEFGQALSVGDCGVQNLLEHSTLWNHKSKARMFSWIPTLPNPTNYPEEKRHFLSRLSSLALTCTDQALRMAGSPEQSYRSDAIAVVLGSGLGNLCDLDPTHSRYFRNGPEGLSPLTIPVNMNNSVANIVSQSIPAHGISTTISTACSSGFNAISYACDLLRLGSAECVVTGGIDLTICPSIIDGWEKMRVLSSESTDPRKACRPFDKNRNGLVLGEGGVIFVLEKKKSIVARNAQIMAKISAIHANCDASDLVAPRLETQIECMQLAIQKSGLPLTDIESVHTHGTGTLKNDRQELDALSAVFGENLQKLELCAIKAQLGHTMGASGTFSLAAATYQIVHGTQIPHINLHDLDWETPLKFSKGVQTAPIKNTLINCFAFGGSNCSVIVENIEG